MGACADVGDGGGGGDGEREGAEVDVSAGEGGADVSSSGNCGVTEHIVGRLD